MNRRFSDHQELEALIAADALDGLDEPDRRRLHDEMQRHGEDCLECARLIEEYSEVATHLALSVDPVPMSAFAERRLFAALDAPAATMDRQPEQTAGVRAWWRQPGVPRRRLRGRLFAGMRTQTKRGANLPQRLFAAAYDRIFDRIDAAGGADHRRRLAQDALGAVLEIGAGTGRNLRLYRRATRVVALEPDPGMRARAVDVARAVPVPVEIVAGRVESLPFPDASFDTVVSSSVLCTASDPARAVAEVRRVLRPGGRLRFYEHVRAEDARLAWWQDRLERPWGWVAKGCHPNRDAVATVSAAGLRLVDLDRFDFNVLPPLVRPHVIGVAERPQ